MLQTITATNVLQQTLQNNQYKIILHQGGSRSSKTWSIFQYYIIKALQGEAFTLTIVRDKLTWIKSTLLKDFEEMIKLYSLPVIPDINVNRPDQVYYLNGSEFAFFGLDYAEKLHGRKQNYTWINEVMEVNKKSFDQLEMRTTEQMILDYNPYDESHWVFDLQKRSDVVVIRSTMLDNPFLPDSIVKKIKSYEPTPENVKQGTADNYMWEVYGLGNKAKLVGTIYNWTSIETIPENAKFLARGLDFGFSNSQTALINVYQAGDEIILDELIYKTGLTNQDIDAEMKALGLAKHYEIYADSAEPKSIEELRRLGWNIKPTTKGVDSVNFGIDLLKAQKVRYTQRSLNIENESRKYKWAEDRNGKSLNEPIKEFDHACDAVRYVALVKLKKRAEVVVLSKRKYGL